MKVTVIDSGLGGITFSKSVKIDIKDLDITLLIDKDGSIVTQAAVKLKGAGYKNIYIYTSGYDTIINHLNGKIEIVTGVDDCGC